MRRFLKASSSKKICNGTFPCKNPFHIFPAPFLKDPSFTEQEKIKTEKFYPTPLLRWPSDPISKRAPSSSLRRSDFVRRDREISRTPSFFVLRLSVQSVRPSVQSGGSSLPCTSPPAAAAALPFRGSEPEILVCLFWSYVDED